MSATLLAEHFRMLRLAIYRGLTCDQLTATTFTVSSSREGHAPYDVDVEKGCPCDSAVYCSHLALAVDRWHENEAEMTARADYFEARRLDFGGLPTRKDAHGDDKRFLRTAVERAREKYAPLFVAVEREGVSF